MKKMVRLMLTAAVLISLIGCGAKEEQVTSYTCKSGNFSIDIPGKNYMEKDEGEETLSLNNGKYAFGVTQISKELLFEKRISNFDEFSTQMKDALMKELSLTLATEEVVSLPNMVSAKGWKLDMEDTTKTQGMVIFAETENAYYQYIVESTEKDYDAEKFTSIMGTLKEIKVTALPEEEVKTHTSESGGFSVEIPGEWEIEDTGMGMLLTKDNAGLKIEKITKEQAGTESLDEFVEIINQSESMVVMESSSAGVEEEFDPGKFKSSKAFVYDLTATDGTKQIYIYLEDEDSFISYNILALETQFDKIFEKYAAVIQTIQ